MKYKVRDKVRVRQWDDMAKEFGLIFGDDIDIPNCTFVNKMKRYCGSVVTIHDIVCNNSRYLVKEDDWNFFWIDDMFEDLKINNSIYAEGTMLKIIKTTEGCYGTENKTGIVTSMESTNGLMPDEPGFNIMTDQEVVWRINCDAKVEVVSPIWMRTKDAYMSLVGKNSLSAEETRETMKENKVTEAKKTVHPKDEDHLKRVEKIQKKIDYYKEKSYFNKIEEVVPERVLNVEIERGITTRIGYEGKIICDERDVFSIEYALYLALAKCDYGHLYTPEGIEKKAKELKYEKKYVKRINQAMKMLAAMEELKKENEEYEALIESRRKKRWERKQRQTDRRAEKKRIQEEKEREEKIQIQTKAYLRAMKAAKEEGLVTTE